MSYWTLQAWLLQELDDVRARLLHQVLDRVPVKRQTERPDGGNSIAWTCLHVARHAQLALLVLGVDAVDPPVVGGDGLGEAESWPHEVDPSRIETYVADVLDASRRYLTSVEPAALGDVPDAEGALAGAGISRDRYAWLYEQWSGQPAAFFVRWPMIGHAVNHVGEMIATRNRMGLSPHR
jgi:hypothetical protein